DLIQVPDQLAVDEPDRGSDRCCDNILELFPGPDNGIASLLECSTDRTHSGLHPVERRPDNVVPRGPNCPADGREYRVEDALPQPTDDRREHVAYESVDRIEDRSHYHVPPGADHVADEVEDR